VRGDLGGFLGGIPVKHQSKIQAFLQVSQIGRFRGCARFWGCVHGRGFFPDFGGWGFSGYFEDRDL
jgi:hypothetical protein